MNWTERIFWIMVIIIFLVSIITAILKNKKGGEDTGKD